MSNQSPSEITHNETKRFPIRKAAAGVAALAVTAAVAGGAGYSVGRKGSNTSEQGSPSAASMAKALNSGKHVVKQAVVEVGFSIPLEAGQGPEDAIAIINPIKRGKNTYNYIDIDHKTGKVTIKDITYTGKLQPNKYFGGRSDAYPHEVTTPLALIESDALEGTADETSYYSVIMSEKSGDTDDLRNVPKGAISEAEYNRQVSEQEGEFSEARVGELLYQGK